MSVEASRPNSHNARSRRTWMYVSNGGSVISTEEAIEVSSFNTNYRYDKSRLCTNGTWRDAQEVHWEVSKLW